MILIKGFFRKKTTKVYLLLFSVLFVSIIILFSYINYFVSMANDIFKDHSQILIISKTEKLDELNKSKNLNLEKAIALIPNYDYKVLGRSCKVIFNQNRVKVDEYITDDCSGLKWEYFYMHPSSEFIMLFPASRRNLDLEKNQIAIGMQSDILKIYDDSGDLEKIKDQKIGFYNNKKNIEFKVSKFYSSEFKEMVISDTDFEELYKNSDLYAYKGILKDYRTDSSVESELREQEDIELVSVGQAYSDYSKMQSLENFKDLVSSLTLVSYLMVFIFIIVFITVIRNTILDEYKNIRTERLLGYNKNQARKYLLLKLFALNILTFIIGTTASILIIILLNYSKVNLNIFNYSLLFKIYGSMLLISLFFCLLNGIRINKNLKLGKNT